MQSQPKSMDSSKKERSEIEGEDQSIENHLQEGKEKDFFEDMQNKLERLQSFAQSLGKEKDSPISHQLLEHFQIDSEEFTNVDSNTIIKETIKRIEKMKKSRKVKKNWSSNDMKVLIWVICKHSQRESINLTEIQFQDEFWKFVASVIPGSNPQSCLFKWLNLRRYKITLHSWKQEEEKLLIELQKCHVESKNKWKFISEQLYKKNPDPDRIFRHPKQCREHYASFLDPNIVKGPWTKDEDNCLLTYIVDHAGEKKWCKLTKVLEGRTQNAIKNRFQLLFTKLKKKKQNKSKAEIDMIVEYLKQNDPEYEIKKQRAQAVKSLTSEKISVNSEPHRTFQSINSLPSYSNLSLCEQPPASKSPVPIIPKVLNHGSNFRFPEGLTLEQKKNKELLLSPDRQSIKLDQSGDSKQEK